MDDNELFFMKMMVKSKSREDWIVAANVAQS